MFTEGALPAPTSVWESRKIGSPSRACAAAGLFGMLASAWQGAREILTDNAATRFVSNMALDRAVRHPGRVLGIGLVLAVLGWGLDTQTQVQTDIAKLAPAEPLLAAQPERTRACDRSGR